MNKIRPLKRLGQNFLIDQNIIKQLVDSIQPKKNEILVEIGPGQGALTFELLKHDIKLTLLEIDSLLFQTLSCQLSHQPNVNLFCQDALKYDYTLVSGESKSIRLVGNLPYNISTPLVFHCLKQAHLFQDMHFMLQKELVNRICACPGNKVYGRLSVMVQYFCRTMALFDVKPESFHPKPKVQSAVICLIPHSIPPYKALKFELFEELVRDAFNMRRKTLQNSLKRYLTAAAFIELNISPKARPETLSVELFVKISNYLASQ